MADPVAKHANAPISGDSDGDPDTARPPKNEPPPEDPAAISGLRPGGAVQPRLWQWLRFFARVLSCTRVPTLFVFIGALVLWWIPQGRDIAVGIVGPSALWSWRAAFLVAVVWMAMACWAYARLLISREFDAQRKSEETGDFDFADPLVLDTGLGAPARAWLKHYPRALSFLVCLGAALVIILRHGLHGFALGFVATGVLLHAFYVERRKRALLNQISHRTGEPARAASVLLAVTVAVSLYASPASLPQWLGSAAVFFLCLATMNSVLSTLVDRTRELRFNYVLASIVGLYGLTLVSVLLWGDNHALRRSQVPARQGRPGVAHALATWQRTAPTVDDRKPMVVMATAGGGLRASYWTARILAALEDHVPTFRDQLFAVSGASGGAVGSTQWVAWQRAAAPEPTGPRCGQAGSGDACWKRMKPLYDVDYLSPAMAGLLGADLAQRFLPVPVLVDRAAYLERGWEAGFARVARRQGAGRDARRADQLARPFLSLWDENEALWDGTAGAEAGRWMPLLLINGTHQQTGARILTTPLRATPEVFAHAADVYDLLLGDADLPASTAAHNAARFAFVSPSGTLAPGAGHIIDGGYAENYGAQTALDLLHAAARAGGRHAVRPLVVQVTNDAQLPDAYLQAFAPGTGSDHGRGALNDVIGPISGLYGAMSGRARVAGEALWRYTRGPAGSAYATTASAPPLHVHLRLFRQPDENDPAPLGWVLSDEARASMDRQLFCCAENRAGLRAIGHALTGRPLTETWMDGYCGARGAERCAR